MTAGVSSCSTCGVLVDDTAKHDRWHESVERATVVALYSRSQAEPDRVKAILEAVSVVTGLPVEDITGERRLAGTVRARHAAWWLLRDLLSMSYPQIARTSGGWDHATVMNGVKRAGRSEEIKAIVKLARVVVGAQEAAA